MFYVTQNSRILVKSKTNDCNEDMVDVVQFYRHGWASLGDWKVGLFSTSDSTHCQQRPSILTKTQED